MNLHQREMDVNGLRMSYFEATGDPRSELTLLFVHGAACHGRMWDATLKSLNPSCRVISVELRGHGRTQKLGPYGWDSLGRDLYSFIRELDLNAIVGVAHSMGGHMLLQAAAMLTSRFVSLLLLEPAIFDPRSYTGARMFDSPEEHPFARRKAIWHSAEEWFQFVRDRTPFKLWDPEVLWDHCRFGVERKSDDSFSLCCPPLVEAEISLNCADTDVYPLLDSIDVPTTVIRAEVARGIRHPLDTVHSTTWPKLVERLPQGRDKYMPELTHFIPMQRPDLVAREVSELIGE